MSEKPLRWPRGSRSPVVATKTVFGPLIGLELPDLALGLFQLVVVDPVVLGLQPRAGIPTIPPEPERQSDDCGECDE